MEKIIFKFQVLWREWECDADAWIIERKDGSRYLKMTNHGEEYEANKKEIEDRIKEYRSTIEESEKALKMLCA